MKLLLIIPYIVSMISGSQILNPANNNQTTTKATNYYNQTIEIPTTGFFITNTKQCYQCNFVVDDYIVSDTLFNEQCANQTISCDNNFCSTLLSKNQDDGEYRSTLGCSSENYCSKTKKQNTWEYENITYIYIACCDDNLCNTKATVDNMLDFYSGKDKVFLLIFMMQYTFSFIIITKNFYFFIKTYKAYFKPICT